MGESVRSKLEKLEHRLGRIRNDIDSAADDLTSAVDKVAECLAEVSEALDDELDPDELAALLDELDISPEVLRSPTAWRETLRQYVELQSKSEERS